MGFNKSYWGKKKQTFKDYTGYIEIVDNKRNKNKLKLKLEAELGWLVMAPNKY